MHLLLVLSSRTRNSDNSTGTVQAERQRKAWAAAASRTISWSWVRSVLAVGGDGARKARASCEGVGVSRRVGTTSLLLLLLLHPLDRQ